METADHKRFYLLLGGLVALLTAAPVMREFRTEVTPGVSNIVLTVVFVGMLGSAVLAVGRDTRSFKILISLGTPVVLLQIVRTVAPSVLSQLARDVASIVMLGYVVLVIVRYLFAAGRVTGNTICAAISIYLLLGVLWAITYSAVELVRPDSFSSSLSGAEDIASSFSCGERSSEALYFSFVTLTTLGYGDVSPVSPTAKMLATAEAIVGQLFLAVLVARLVGLHITNASRNDSTK